MCNEFTFGPGMRCRCHLWFDLSVWFSRSNVKCNEFSKRQILEVSFVIPNVNAIGTNFLYGKKCQIWFLISFVKTQRNSAHIIFDLTVRPVCVVYPNRDIRMAFLKLVRLCYQEIVKFYKRKSDVNNIYPLVIQKKSGAIGPADYCPENGDEAYFLLFLLPITPSTKSAGPRRNMMEASGTLCSEPGLKAVWYAGAIPSE